MIRGIKISSNKNKNAIMKIQCLFYPLYLMSKFLNVMYLQKRIEDKKNQNNDNKKIDRKA